MKQLLAFLFIGSAALAQSPFKNGTWRGVLTLHDQAPEIILPFNFSKTESANGAVITIFNATEKIRVEEVIVKGDSVNFKMPVFDTEFKTVLKNDTLRGWWINNSKKEKNKIAFEAYYNQSYRFVTDKKASVNFSGRYEVTFNKGKEDEYKAVGLFEQKGQKVTGTFLTETGDYRYLEGVAQNNNMTLSAFDGTHAFLFFAGSPKKSGNADSLSGQFFAGISGMEEWVAIRNPKFELHDPESLTTVKPGSETAAFSFKNLRGETVSLSDPRYANKVVILQVMGSWCPNCMDETVYFAELYKQYKGKGLEIVALAYERSTDFDKAKVSLERLKKRFGVEYEILFTGLTGRESASKSLPFLSGIMAFPTTVIVDRQHKIKTVYTGFSGPATGKEYEQYKKKTEALIQSLLLAK